MCCGHHGKLVWKRRVNKILFNPFLCSYGKSIALSRGLILGVWSACASVGNIIGAVLAATFLQYGYDYAFLVCCVLLVCCAIMCFFGIVPSPADVGMCAQIVSVFSFLFFVCRYANKRGTSQRRR